MNTCEGAFSLQRSVLSAAEREAGFVSVEKDGLSRLLCDNRTPGGLPRCSVVGEQRALPFPAPLGISE